jgi:hypothetical protein
VFDAGAEPTANKAKLSCKFLDCEISFIFILIFELSVEPNSRILWPTPLKNVL